MTPHDSAELQHSQTQGNVLETPTHTGEHTTYAATAAAVSAYAPAPRLQSLICSTLSPTPSGGGSGYLPLSSTLEGITSALIDTPAAAAAVSAATAGVGVVSTAHRDLGDSSDQTAGMPGHHEPHQPQHSTISTAEHHQHQHPQDAVVLSQHAGHYAMGQSAQQQHHQPTSQHIPPMVHHATPTTPHQLDTPGAATATPLGHAHPATEHYYGEVAANAADLAGVPPLRLNDVSSHGGEEAVARVENAHIVHGHGGHTGGVIRSDDAATLAVLAQAAHSTSIA